MYWMVWMWEFELYPFLPVDCVPRASLHPTTSSGFEIQISYLHGPMKLPLASLNSCEVLKCNAVSCPDWHQGTIRCHVQRKEIFWIVYGDG